MIQELIKNNNNHTRITTYVDICKNCSKNELNLRHIHNKLKKYIYFLKTILALLIMYIIEANYLITYEVVYVLIFITLNIIFLSNLYII